MALRDIDRQGLIELLIAYGIEPVKIEGDERQIVFYFLEEDVNKLENRYLSNQSIHTEWKMVIHARELWNNTIILWKSKIRLAMKKTLLDA